MTRAFGRDRNQPVTPTHMVSLVAELTEFVLLHWDRPITTLERMEQEQRAFDILCADLTNLIKAPDQQTMRAQIAPLRQRLTNCIERRRQEVT